MTGPDPLDEALAGLPDIVAPAVLEDRTVESLRARGAFERGRRFRAGRGLAAAAALLVGFAVGRLTASPTQPTSGTAGRQYLILLSTLADEASGRPPAAVEAVRVEEYRAWAGSLAREGRLVSAEKLAPREGRLSGWPPRALGPPVDASGPSGFFLVRARDLDDALAIARSCPHLRHGGSVSVRPVDPT